MRRQLDLRVQTFGGPDLITDMPVVRRGTLQQLRRHCQQQGLEFVRRPEMLFGGYYRTQNGETVYHIA